MDASFRAIAATLASARKTGSKIVTRPERAPRDLNQAYEIQDLYIQCMGEPVAGWKVGATGRAGREALQVDEPVCGPIFATGVYSSPANVAAPANSLYIVEAEFAFRMGHDLSPDTAPHQRDTIVAAVETLHPAIEIVDSRLTKGLKSGGRWVVADGSANLAFVHGGGRSDWRTLDLSEHEVLVSLNGARTTSGNGAAAFGNPMNVLVWLVQHLVGRGLTLRRGDWVSTGLVTDVVTLRSGDVYVADFGSLGVVELTRG